jgi:hypothetical protein
MITELQAQIEAVQRELVAAQRAGRSREVYLRQARLEDLIDIGSRHGIDVAAWVDPSLRLWPPSSPRNRAASD